MVNGKIEIENKNFLTYYLYVHVTEVVFPCSKVTMQTLEQT